MTKYSDPPGFAEWEVTLPESFRRDPIWRTPAYRYATWLADLVKDDARRLIEADALARDDAKQLIRAVGSISANLAEGYSRSTGPERARYYDYGIASSRESRDWYFKARKPLGVDVMEHRHSLLDRIIRILTAIIPRERSDSRDRDRDRGDGTPRRRRTSRRRRSARRDDSAADGE
jgi:four helix bundle protein